jgi:molecular chaperone DnaJ
LDYYETLGITKEASPDEIRKAFRRKAREYHPDINQEEGAEEQFKQVNEAHEVLSDPEKRQMYDTYGTTNPREVPRAHPMEDMFSDLFRGNPFGDIFGRGSASGPRVHRSSIPPDIQMRRTIPLATSLFGGTLTVEYDIVSSCPDCNEYGHAIGGDCPDCAGTGVVVKYVRRGPQTIMQRAPCEVCFGSGKKLKEQCETCGGKGHLIEKKVGKIKLREGIINNTIQAAGLGNRPFGRPPGNLFIAVSLILPDVDDLSEEDRTTLNIILERLESNEE